MKKTSPPVYVFAAFVAMLMAHLLAPIAHIVMYPWNLLGAAPLLLGTAGPWLVVPLLGVVFDVIFVQQEEKKLEMKFGDDFLRYKAKVRRWI